MANIFENKDRRVVPNWRSFKKTATLGELDNTINLTNTEKQALSIEDYIEDWKENKTIPHAGDLVSAATVNGIKNNEFVIDAAKFIITNSSVTTKPQQSIAQNILSKIDPTSLLHKLENISLDDFNFYVNPNSIHERIKILKKASLQYPYNSIIYVELARNYSIIGQSKKAMTAMKIALQLSPDNRFIIRSAVRLFAHNEDLEFSHDLLRKSPLTNLDPWLTSAEIALATLRNRTSRFIKKGTEMVNSKKFIPFSITELASSLGTVELLNGSSKKSKALFQTSLLAPNDNSLAQAEWASTKDHSLDFDLSKFKVNHNFEALALENFSNKKLDLALDNTFRWFLDMPFSKRPVMFGAHIASTLLNDQEKSRGFLKAGLISHPNDAQIINNLVYSLALENNTREALEYLDKLSSHENIEKSTSICLTATKGLVYFRSGFYDAGRQNYIKAIEEAKAINSQYYYWLAILNYSREEILINSEYAEPLLDVIGHIPNNTKEEDVNKLKIEVLALYEQNKVKRI